MSKLGELYVGDQVRGLDTSRLMTIYDFDFGRRTALCNYLIGTHMRCERWPVERLRKVERKKTAP